MAIKKLDAAIATNRFGLGASPGEIAAIGTDARGWLKAQINRPQSVVIKDKSLPSTETVASDYVKAQFDMRSMSKGSDEKAQRRKKMRQSSKQYLQAEIIARNDIAVSSRASFNERWVRFWSNHFTVSTRNPMMVSLVGPFEREAIRPHVFGTFENLLKAAIFHPAMLIYLDNHRSIGPTTRAGTRTRRGLNENLAREVLELHTLGVDGGYSQGDVTSFAKALTGWTISTPPHFDKDFGKTVFAKRVHEPGKQTILGRQYSGNKSQAQNILTDLSVHASTASHIATKLARHFISDTPPDAAIKMLSDTFMRTRGNLKEVALRLIDLPQAWEPEQRKIKTPEELLISTARALGANPVFGRGMTQVYKSFGQVPFSATAPDGWPDVAAHWAGSDAVQKRLEWANALARKVVGQTVPTDFLDEALGDLASDKTRLSVSRAGSPAQGLTLALMSPEFQRR